MKVLVAKKRGFCFGVEHAIEMAQKLLDRQISGDGIPKKVYCLGPLIHNSQVVERLAGAGLRVVASLDQIKSTDQENSEAPTVLVRSHGCRPELLEEIDAPALIVAVPDDPGHPLSTAQELADRIPFAQLRVVASLADVDEIRATATHFLDELAAAGC